MYAGWLTDDDNDDCGVFVVLAGPGFGKTTFASSVCAAQGDTVLAVHLCRSDDDQSRDPVAIVKSLAVQLARSVPEFRAALASDLDALRATVSDPKASARSLLGDLIVKPLMSPELAAKMAAKMAAARMTGRRRTPLRDRAYSWWCLLTEEATSV